MTFWDGIDGLWHDQNWGSVADWFAAVGAVAAFALAVYLYWRGQRDKRRATGDEFSSRMFVQNGPWLETHAFVVVNNAGEHPIYLASIRSKPGAETSVDQSFTQARELTEQLRSDHGVINPKQRLIEDIPLSSRVTDPQLYLVFSDSFSKSWARDLTTGKYISSRKIRRWNDMRRAQLYKEWGVWLPAS
ncbi:hypothetical protein [Subtercola sp. RTI3]|uniref:hypothetical protein n=1 Tax=Subtercola sp. RTI3 TaxID=3048639 RepID=UPI002B227F7A|nr:hypothetical protein [Subtercola sp. RTI3]MEA9985655.1 hypothetical protein [Subtercola sp. RTI3]